MSITIILIIITIAISMAGWRNPVLQYKLTMNPYAVTKNGQFYRMITSGFIHNNWTHLGFNMFTFYFFGSNIEYLLSRMFGAGGSYYFIALYVIAIVVSDIPSILKYKDQPNYNSLGASGGVSAIVFCSIMFFPLEKIYLFAIIGIPGFILGIIYIIYSYYEGNRMADNVNHHAHLIGALFGVVFSIFIEPSVALSFIEQVASYRFF
ncbi:MAG: membrane associated rhomboid family serine protease [Cyclobacteriaceae bacterium]|jgi:membrane associated rhomboid family serine protease